MYLARPLKVSSGTIFGETTNMNEIESYGIHCSHLILTSELLKCARLLQLTRVFPHRNNSFLSVMKGRYHCKLKGKASATAIQVYNSIKTRWGSPIDNILSTCSTNPFLNTPLPTFLFTLP